MLSTSTTRPPGRSTRAISAATARRTSPGSSWNRYTQVTCACAATLCGSLALATTPEKVHTSRT